MKTVGVMILDMSRLPDWKLVEALRKEYGVAGVTVLPDVDADFVVQSMHERNQLIMQVSHKYPEETRFETALRYLQERENATNGPASGSCEGTGEEKAEVAQGSG